MAVSGRVKRSVSSDASFEALVIGVNQLSDQLDAVKKQMATVTGGSSINAPLPSIPFKIGERADIDGIYITVSVQVPKDVSRLVIQIVRTVDNQKKASDVDDPSAIKRARRKVLRFELQISEDESADGVVEREIGPLKEKKSSTDMSYQLIRLVSDNGITKASDPAATPFKPTGPFTTGAQIFPALVVDTGGITTFTVGQAVSLPPKTPSLADVICNRVSTEGSTSSAKVTVRLWADQTQTMNFATVGANAAYVVFKQVGDTASETVPGFTGEVDNRLKFGGPLEDTTVNFVLIDCILEFGVQYEYKKAITSNGAGKAVALGTGVNVIAGKGLAVANLAVVDATNFPGKQVLIAATQQDGHHTYVNVRFRQPTGSTICDLPVVYLKRIEFYTRTSRDGGNFVLEEKATGLDEESYTTPGTLISVTRKVKHRANDTSLAFRVRLVGVGKDPIGAGNFLDSDIATGDSLFNALPATPSLTDIQANLPDDDTDNSDAYTVFRVYASTDRISTFRTVGADAAFVVLRRQKATGTGAGDETGADTTLPKFGGPIDNVDAAFTDITVRNLKLGRRYLWVKNITQRNGTPAKSAVGNVSFRAGFGFAQDDSQDITRIMLLAPIGFTHINKHHSKVTLTFFQPFSGVPVLLKNCTLYQKLVTNGDGGPVDSQFVDVEKKVLHDVPEYSSNTAIQGKNTDNFTKTVNFKIQHPTNSTGIQYYIELTAQGGQFVDVGQNVAYLGLFLTPFTDGNTGGGITGNGPSAPSSGFIANSQSTSTDPDREDAQVVLTVQADRLNSSATFASVGAVSVYAVLRRSTDSAEPLKFGGSLSPTELQQTFIQIECPGLRAGKSYVWTRNIETGGDGTSLATVNSVTFSAGNFDTAVADITNFTVGPVIVQDSRHSLVPVTFTQGSQPVLLRKLRLFQSQSAVSGDSLKVVDREELQDALDNNNNPVNSVGVKNFTFVTKHKRDPNNVTYQCDLIAVGSNNRKLSNTITTGVTAADDTGPPQYVTVVPNIRLRWKPSHLRFRFRLPDFNMTSFDIVKVLVTIGGLGNGLTFVWNPDTGTFANPSTALPDSSVYADTNFTLDIGKASFDSTPADRPDATNKGFEFPMTAYGSGAGTNLISNTTFIEVFFYVYNQFGGVGVSFLKTSQKLFYRPNDGTGLIWNA